MFSFFRKKPASSTATTPSPVPTGATGALLVAPAIAPTVAPIDAADRRGWMARLRSGLRRTGSSIATVFTGTRIDEALYEDLESALLMADAGVKATEFLLQELKRRVKESKATDPKVVKQLLADVLTELLLPLQKTLTIGAQRPTVIMVTGVNGAGKTTSIGKLTHHFCAGGATVLLAAADTFRAAAREQLGVWAERNAVEIISQQGGDPAAVSFDAVSAGRSRGKDLVLVDTAGRLPTQLHLMEELRKIKRIIAKADAGGAGQTSGRERGATSLGGGVAAGPRQGDAAPSGPGRSEMPRNVHSVGPAGDRSTGQLRDLTLRDPRAAHEVASVGAPSSAPHEILLVIDGNTGQNALAQVRAFDDALTLTGLIVTKLDGTAKGGVIAAIARERPVPIYFIGVGEKLEDLETFDAREFAQALLG